ncbi:MAG: 2-oxo-4-hydroxy-4-carboxy-5-ureidoimidazoline decarboxylase [Edaphobacter sp.]|uniref:2-oxo-4-hydroxy-4-carboxy-5-ureidoimidazoline decarboxylase n=1 Tax=Edaphobacter sp. TaxID=1934404 RepID=UPI002384B63F|nr:2-oxo-4-hydroxy-4-carboxy-5-ureidoimidazoline decarboxylase [Edaphobacter sp.]MDE1177954.1 2-oxo-4-hydroxy-4-carboxy-5-ureidoimidazoline decarboxylase [Edaphobacter sp.]
MRSMPSSYEMVAPRSLHDALGLMAKEPGLWTPVAGGTEVMVQFGAGRLMPTRFVSIRKIDELRGIAQTETELRIGAGCTYADLRRDAIVGTDFPLLSTAAAWTGSIANQNRGTLGGNIVNASPAADSLPALLVYEAELVLVSVRGERRVRYGDFHVGYKKTLLAPDELIRTIVLPRRYVGWLSVARKVGPRNAQAISKLCMAALARMDRGRIAEIRVAFGSMAPMPLRMRGVESSLNGQQISSETIRKARRALEAEVSPIDDIRSTRAYRIAVAGNLLEEFLRGVTSNDTLSRWNVSPAAEAVRTMLSCCGSTAWAEAMVAARPFAYEASVLERAGEIWRGMSESDWDEAFRSHPRIGERHADRATTAASAKWSEGEQRGVAESEDAVKRAIAEGNRRYEERFGRIFIVCATGKKPEEILSILERRLANNEAMEMRESAAQQEEIMQLRLAKWLRTEAGA